MKKENHEHNDGLSCGCGHCHEKEEKSIKSSSHKNVLSNYRFDFIKIILAILMVVGAILISKNIII